MAKKPKSTAPQRAPEKSKRIAEASADELLMPDILSGKALSKPRADPSQSPCCAFL
jgi:hypothetical protein